MNAKSQRTPVARTAPSGWRGALSALCLLAASPALAADAPAVLDSQGRPVRATQGGCVVGSLPASGEAPEACRRETRRSTWRILQNLVPLPTVSYLAPESSPEAALPPAETLRFVARTPFGVGAAAIAPELREELMDLLRQLEGFQRVERFEVIAHGDGPPRAPRGPWLADARVRSTRAWFIERGVPAAMIDGRGAPPGDAGLQERIEVLVTVRGRR